MTTIGFSTPVLPNTVIQAMLRGLASAAARRGGRVLATDAALDVAKQAGDITRLVDAGVDALIVYPAGDPESLRTALDAAIEAGVLLFAHDDIGHASVVTQLVTPVDVMGALAADLLAELLQGRGNIVIIDGVPAPALLERVAGFRRRLESRHPGIRVVASISNTTDVVQGAESAMADTITSGLAPDGVFGYNDASAIGAARAAAAAGLSLVTVGNNAEPHGVQAVAQGLISATVDRHPVELALQAAAVILDTLERRIQISEAPAFVTIVPSTVTKDNVESFIPWERRCDTPPLRSWEVL
jgi:ribose transport system substrate-binding protein/ribose transport system permease protein